MDEVQMTNFTLGERAILHKLVAIDDRLTNIEQGNEVMGTAQEAVTAALQGDQSAIEALAARVGAQEKAKDEHIVALEAEIAKLKANGVDVAGLESSLATFKTSVEAIDQAPAPSPEPTPAPVPAPTKSVYTFTAAEGIVPDERFTAAGFETVPAEGAAAEPLFEFSGDVAAGEANGASVPGYAPYTGAVQAKQ